MGLLSEGQPLSWKDTSCLAKFVQQRGLVQFATIYKNAASRRDKCHKWGDEIEYMLVKFDHENKKVRVSLKAAEIFRLIEEHKARQKNGINGYPTESYWNPEFGSYMVESTPGTPYGDSCDDRVLAALNSVGYNMRFRRQQVQQLLGPDEYVMSVTSFPRLGCPGFTFPHCDPKPKTSLSGSLFFPDEAIYGGHPRFKTIVKNIRARRGRKVIINLPIYQDVNTAKPFIEHFDDDEARVAAKPNHVYMDAMGFGMGCCCLQMTFQAAHIDEARLLYDQLSPFCPIAMALSAAAPIFRGYLVDRDCRWEVISCAVDDRTREESGEADSQPGTLKISKSRYDSIDSYISKYGEKFNDIPLTYHKSHYDTLIDHGVDPLMARHVAHLFIRDPITLYREKLDQRDDESDHFESTNWQTMRFKPPPSANSSIGWRVEFRPLEVQTTDHENAAYVVFVALLTRLILSYRINLLIPISMVDENMRIAQNRDAIEDAKFWFRKDITKCCQIKRKSSQENVDQSNHMINGSVSGSNRTDSENNYKTLDHEDEPWDGVDDDCDPQSCATLMTINEIINGTEEFPGLVPLLRQYLSSVEIDAGTLCTINNYLELISDRAALRTKTTARWIRDFVREHPKYNRDSVVSDEIAYDLLMRMQAMTKS
ncbi:Glutamate--cysteine ligase catalytic subunit [Fragariocoptes setiger]|uniref:Glutamate--cysteine ligase n=1 Tax=Fragariocoptes setiger TaxID=1670756 RepID=A0ABQ7S8A9_9ACAR|nr:Glutamate--cysteine ligase catalytic subunit [Fragariocoptes setiger]